MNPLTILEVTRKLIGEVDPCCDSEIDRERAKNLETLFYIIDSLLMDASYVAEYRNAIAHPAQEMGKSAYEMLYMIKNNILIDDLQKCAKSE